MKGNEFWNPFGKPFRYGLLVNIWLLAMVVGTALVLVRWQYNSRSLVAALEKSQNVGKELASNNASALAEKRALSAPARVEQIATQQLEMKTVEPSVTLYLTKP